MQLLVRRHVVIKAGTGVPIQAERGTQRVYNYCLITCDNAWHVLGACLFINSLMYVFVVAFSNMHAYSNSAGPSSFFSCASAQRLNSGANRPWLYCMYRPLEHTAASTVQLSCESLTQKRVRCTWPNQRLHQKPYAQILLHLR